MCGARPKEGLRSAFFGELLKQFFGGDWHETVFVAGAGVEGFRQVREKVDTRFRIVCLHRRDGQQHRLRRGTAVHKGQFVGAVFGIVLRAGGARSRGKAFWPMCFFG